MKLLLRTIQNARSVDAAGLDVVGCLLEVTLTLLEGASVQGRPPAEGQSCIIYVTGQHGWLHGEKWVLHVALIAAVLGTKGVTHSAQSIGNLRRKVVLAAAITCAASHSGQI